MRVPANILANLDSIVLAVLNPSSVHFMFSRHSY